MSENTKVLKFTILVEEVNKVIEPVAPTGSFAGGITRSLMFQLNTLSGVRSPLRLVIDSKGGNEYSNIILNNAKFSLDAWSEYINGKNVNDTKAKISATKKLIELLKRTSNRKQALNFVFWMMFISAVDSKDYEEKVSEIADFSFMIGLNDDVIKDLTQVVKLVLGVEISELEFTTEEVREHFINVINMNI